MLEEGICFLVLQGAYPPNGNHNAIEIVTSVHNSHPSLTLPFAALGAILATWLGTSPVTVAVQVEPQAYPLGQQPPPSVPGQLNHPLAQPPVVMGPAVIPLPVGATTVTPSVLTRAVEALVGHEVLAQSRPT